MTDAAVPREDVLIAQLKELNERSRTYGRQFWQVSFAYVVGAGVGLGQIVGKNEGRLCVPALALTVIAVVGVFTLWHLGSLYCAAYRCFRALQSVEQKLGLRDDDPSKWTPGHLQALIALAAVVLVASLIAASYLLGCGACR